MFALVIQAKIAVLTMGPLGKGNSIGRAHWRELAAAVAGIDPAAVRVLLLRSGDARLFSAGADVSEFELLRTDEAARTDFRLALRDGIGALADCPVPTVSLVEGGCFGAAVALARACDICVAGEEARFAVPPAKLGIAYPAEDIARIAAAVGAGQTARLIFSGETIEAAEALRIGLADLDGGAEAAERLCGLIAANSGQSLVGLKAMLKAAVRGGFGAETDRLFEDSFASRDFAAGLAAFRARSSPEFE